MDDLLNLQGKTALITGASRGIGLEIVRQFSRHGAYVIAGVREINENLTKVLSEMAQQYGNKITPEIVDLSNADTASDCARRIATQYEIDVLVNNAGIASGSLFK
jgi:NAD(P)-dependent dehydrogenase (short-subunit alcohol dehydrogenase family)